MHHTVSPTKDGVGVTFFTSTCSLRTPIPFPRRCIAQVGVLLPFPRWKPLFPIEAAPTLAISSLRGGENRRRIGSEAVSVFRSWIMRATRHGIMGCSAQRLRSSWREVLWEGGYMWCMQGLAQLTLWTK
jgi:hypothetical protein